ncbi:hypothetical protein KY331_03595 [Candidatus Woesearchaeota archaeon]|nr:hypothetical protein [Candidatus Woesearchaeota archaeon]
MNNINNEPLFSTLVENKKEKVKGFVVIHSMGKRGSCGGIRLVPDMTLEEVQGLAKAMTFKYSFFRRETGGAKGGFIMPYNISKKERKKILRKIGFHLSPFMEKGIYYPWTDMNSNNEDMLEIYKGAGIDINIKNKSDSSLFTAFSTFAGLIAVAKFLNLKPKDCKITIEGLGNVGGHLIKEIDKWGGKVIGVSTRLGCIYNDEGLLIPDLIKLKNRFSDRFVKYNGPWKHAKTEKIFELSMNLHVPCARPWSLDKKRAEKISAKAIIPAANIPYTKEAEKILSQRGIITLPDFIINGGGVTGSSLKDLGGNTKEIKDIFMNEFKKMIIGMLKKSEEEKTNIIKLSENIANRRFQELNTKISKIEYLEKILKKTRLLPKYYYYKKQKKIFIKTLNNAILNID